MNPISTNPKKLLSGLRQTALMFGVAIAFLFLVETAFQVSNYKPKWIGSSKAFFDSNLFVDNEGDGTIGSKKTNESLTAYFHPQQFEKKHPKTFRVISVGGSSTYGWGCLDPAKDCFSNQFELRLKELEMTKQIESINAGGIGYGSFRVAVLMREITQYNPDLILVYCGHNEFWEYPIYEKVFGEISNFERIKNWLEYSLLYNFLRDFMLESNKNFKIPNLFKGSYEIFDQSKYRLAKERFRENIRAIIQTAKDIDCPIILSTLPANLKVDPTVKTDWLWDASHHLITLEKVEMEKWESLFNEGLREYKNENYTQALIHLDSASKIDSTFANLMYFEALCYEQLGQYTKAHRSYWKHIDFSRRLIVQDFNLVIQMVCEEEGVTCVDAVSLFEQESSNGIPGYNLFVDSMHPNREGHQLLAGAYLEAFIKTQTSP